MKKTQRGAIKKGFPSEIIELLWSDYPTRPALGGTQSLKVFSLENSQRKWTKISVRKRKDILWLCTRSVKIDDDGGCKEATYFCKIVLLFSNPTVHQPPILYCLFPSLGCTPSFKFVRTLSAVRHVENLVGLSWSTEQSVTNDQDESQCPLCEFENILSTHQDDYDQNRNAVSAHSAIYAIFRLIAHILRFCDKKYRILTFRLSGSLWLALRLSLAPSGSLLLSEFSYKVFAWLTRPLLSS